jgi:sugar phosphate isomerase/epimerase
MRLGGPVFEPVTSPEEWVAALKRLGYSAAYCPLGDAQDEAAVRAYEAAAKEANIVIAEVGAWSNPMAPDETARKQALTLCQERLALADAIGANCCVNIAGSRGARWDGHDPLNLTKETFDLVVETTRAIIDGVKPKRTHYTLETMPWMYPDSTDSYARLVKAINRKHFAVHFDPVNLVCSPQRYYSTGALIRDFVSKLGPLIRSCHAKDIILREPFMVHLDECRPGTGGLNYAAFLTEVSKVGPDVPVMLEHLPNAEEYTLAAEHMRKVAGEVGVEVR